MNYSNLTIAIETLEGLTNEEFFFGDTIKTFDEENNLDHVCDVIGWTPIMFPELVKWFTVLEGTFLKYHTVRFKDSLDKSLTHKDIGEKLFGISEEEVVGLFTPNAQYRLPFETKQLSVGAPKEDVIELLKKFVEYKLSEG